MLAQELAMRRSEVYGLHADTVAAVISKLANSPRDLNDKQGTGSACARIYKICSGFSPGARPKRQGVYRGSADDVRDGFIHFRSAAQVRGDRDENILRADRTVPGRGRCRRAGRRAALGAARAATNCFRISMANSISARSPRCSICCTLRSDGISRHSGA